METTSPISLPFLLLGKKAAGWSSGEQCPTFYCCRGERKGEEPSPAPQIHSPFSSTHGFGTPNLCREVCILLFHATEHRDASHPISAHPRGGHRHITTPKLGILATENRCIYIKYILGIWSHTKSQPPWPQGLAPLPELPHLCLQRGWREAGCCTCFRKCGLGLKYLSEGGRRWGRGVLAHESWQDAAAVCASLQLAGRWITEGRPSCKI